MINHFVELFKRKTGKDVKKQARSIEKLRREVEKAKRTLSSEHQTKVEVEFFYQNDDFVETLTRAKFEELNMDLFRATMVTIDNVLKDAKLQKTDIAEVLLVGGSTRIPKIRQMLKEYFDGKEPARSINPDEAVGERTAILIACHRKRVVLQRMEQPFKPESSPEKNARKILSSSMSIR